MKLSCLAKWWFTTILIFHEQGDTYANQISERVLNSVENKKIMGKLTFLNPEFFVLLIPIAIIWLSIKETSR
jgi:hypothetical protein